MDIRNEGSDLLLKLEELVFECIHALQILVLLICVIIVRASVLSHCIVSLLRLCVLCTMAATVGTRAIGSSRSSVDILLSDKSFYGLLRILDSPRELRGLTSEGR